MDRTTRHISELHLWEQNPRRINERDFDRLKSQVEKLGQYKPLLVMPDGTILGGNMRFRAYQEVGIEDVWVSTVDFVENETGMWHAVVNGEQKDASFPSKETAMLEYALSDNDRAGYTDDDILTGLLSATEIDTALYAIDMDPPTIIANWEPRSEQEPEEFKYQVIITVESPERQQELAQQFIGQGIKTDLKTKAVKPKHE